MKHVNMLVRLPELTGTMRQLSMELVKAGIMVDDVMPIDPLMEDEEDEANAEIDKVLQEVLHGKLSKVQSLRVDQPVDEEPLAEEEIEDQEATLEQMRGRLEALKSWSEFLSLPPTWPLLEW